MEFSVTPSGVQANRHADASQTSPSGSRTRVTAQRQREVLHRLALELRHRLSRLACVGVPRHILERRQQQRFGGRHGMRQPGMLGGLGLDDFYRYQAPLFRQRP